MPFSPATGDAARLPVNSETTLASSPMTAIAAPTTMTSTSQARNLSVHDAM
ncbi:hypothetical protein ACFQL1_08665 [Halomicroarcula sp. GCM10025709]|uniref:hypothetical protein n=1 Tax=Halomicroarcula sp. GCM10025709 TaxID=3252669 RepID=UPI0036202574